MRHAEVPWPAPPAGRRLRIGVVADSHGLLRDAAVEALRGCALIVHAGDIGRPEVLDRLRTIAPLQAIVGNVDRGPWAQRLPQTLTLQLGGQRVHVLHDLKQRDARAEGCRVVISGHSHQPRCVEQQGVLYLNPGSIGPRRFRLPISMAYLELADGELRAWLHPLPD